MKEDRLPEWLENSGIQFDKNAIANEYATAHKRNSPPGIRVLIVLGTSLASVLLFSLLITLVPYPNQGLMLCVGILSILSGLSINQKGKNDAVDTLAISLALLGYASLAAGFSQTDLHEDTIFASLAIVSLTFIFFSRGFVLPFLGVVSFFSLSYIWIVIKEIPLLTPALSLVMLLLLWAMFYREGHLIARFRRGSTRYAPFCLGLLVSLMASHYLFTPLIGMSVSERIPENYPLYFSIPNALLCLVSFYLFLPEMGVYAPVSKSALLVGLGVILSITLFAPTISLSILLLTMTFRNNHRTGFALSIVSLLAAIGLYYYDLHYSLLVKSILLMVSGLFFLAGFKLIQYFQKSRIDA